MLGTAFRSKERPLRISKPGGFRRSVPVLPDKKDVLHGILLVLPFLGSRATASQLWDPGEAARKSCGLGLKSLQGLRKPNTGSSKAWRKRAGNHRL